jgi:hypothetical protein
MSDGLMTRRDAETIHELREQVTTLRETRAAHDVRIDALAVQVAGLTAVVTELNGTLNRGKGALWAVTCAAATVGASVTGLIEWVRH